MDSAEAQPRRKGKQRAPPQDTARASLTERRLPRRVAQHMHNLPPLLFPPTAARQVWSTPGALEEATHSVPLSGMSDNEEEDRPDQLFGGARPSTAPAARTIAEPAAPAEPANAPAPPSEAMAAASLRPSTAAAVPATVPAAAATASSSEAALPPPPPPSEAISGASVSACPNFEALRTALAKTDDWQYSPDHRAGIERAKKYVEGSDKDFLAGFFVCHTGLEPRTSRPQQVCYSHT